MADEKPYKNTAEKLLADLHSRHHKLIRESRLSVLFLFAGVILAGYSLFLFAEQTFYFTPEVKSLFWAVILLSAALLSWWISGKRATPDFTRYYRTFCEKHGFSDLENALDLYLDSSGEKPGMYFLAIERNLKQIDSGRFQEQLNHFSSAQRDHRTYLTAFCLLLISTILAGTVSWSNSDTVERTLGFWETYEKPNPWEFVISPGDTTLEHGSLFEPEMEILGDNTSLPDRVTLAVKTDIEDEYRHRPMDPSGGRSFRSHPLELTGDAEWYIIMDEYESRRFQVHLQLRPRFEDLTVRISPPGYTGLPETTHSYPFARLSAYGGSDIAIEGKVNKQLDGLTVHTGDGDLQMQPSEEDSLKAGTSFTLQQSDSVRFDMSDRDGLTNRNPFRFDLRMLEDDYPVVVIEEPSADLSDPDPDRIDILYRASDDFGLTRAELNWELHRAYTTDTLRESQSLDPPASGEADEVSKDLAELDLRPRDQLTFWISVSDNDEFNGYKSAVSRRISLEIPSVSARLEEVNRQERDVQSDLDDVSESHSRMEQEYERLRERMIENSEPGWEEEEMVADMQEQQKQMEESVRQLSEQFEEVRREIENNSRISDETRQAYDDLQQMIDQLDDPELMKALEELRESMQEFSRDNLQEAMENFEFNDEVYKERLERTLELFKTLKMNSDLDRLAAQYEDLSERMKNVSEGDKSTDEQVREQQGVYEDTNRLGQQLEDLDSQPPGRSEEQLRQLKEESSAELEDIRREIDDLIEQGKKSSQDSSEQQEAGSRSAGDSSGDAADADQDEQQQDGQPQDEQQHDGQPQDEQQQDGQPQDSQQQDGQPQDSQQQESGPDEQARRQQAIGEQFESRAEAFREARQQMGGQQIQVNLMALQQSLYTLLELSDVQEDLTRQSGRTESRSQRYTELARDQQNVHRQFSQVADTLFRISSEIPNLSNTINRKKTEIEQSLARTVDQMSEREQETSVLSARESLGGINELASMLAEVIDQLMNQQNGGGAGSMTMQQMIEEMQNMSGNQQMMNDQLQAMINDMQGERLSLEQSERLEQLAHRQNEIRRQMQEMQRSGEFSQGDRALSDLQRMTEQMEEAINDMRGNMVDPLMVERQQNILSRMLDAEESLQERGRSEEYEGRQAEDNDRADRPPEVTAEELEQEIRTRLQDPDYTRFSDDYQRLIERYFDLIRQIDQTD